MNKIAFICALFTLVLLPAQNEKIVFNKIDSLNALAQKNYTNNDFATAFSYFNESLKLSDSINDSYGSAVSNFSLGRIYYYMKKYKEAEKFYNLSLEQSGLINDNYLMSHAYLQLGLLHDEIHDSKNVIPFYKKALNYASKNEVYDCNNEDKREHMLFLAHLNLANTYLSEGSLQDAFIFILRAKNNIENLPQNPRLNAEYQFVYGQYLFDKMSYNMAKIRFNNAINILEGIQVPGKSSENKLLSKVYKSLADSYIQLEKDRKAYAALTKHNEVKDIFINEERIKQDNIAKSEFFTADYKQAAILAKEQVVLQKEVSEKIKMFSIVTALAAFILFVLILVLFKNFKSNSKLNSILKMRNDQLLLAKEQVENSSALKTKFISNITHELRTPLYGVVGLSSLLLEGNNLSKRDTKYLESIKYSGNYILELVNDVLQMGKIESETMELKSTPTDLKPTIERIISSFENRLQETNNKLKLEYDESIPELVDCDQVRLTQILVNLVGNSIKFTENGDICLRVMQRALQNNKVALTFEVEDNGAGISKKDQEKVFQSFTQVSKETNVNYQGTGLGLPIAQKLVSLFGGTIELESTLGEGSKFSFTISLELSKISKEDSFNDKKSESKYITPQGNSNILVVEDNKINQIVTRKLLEKEQFQCTIANNGVEALKAMEENDFDLILMDINMPVMGGNEATKKIRETNTNIPIIALTAADIEEVKKDYKSIGYNEIITKPFDNHRFFQVITTSIQESKLRLNNEFYSMALVS